MHLIQKENQSLAKVQTIREAHMRCFKIKMRKKENELEDQPYKSTRGVL